jgi:AraC-type DNA-binding domain-containing proteins
MQQYELEVVEHLKEAPMKNMIVSIVNSCPHFHYDYEIVFVLKGKLLLRAGSEGYLLNVADMVLVNVGEIHSISSLEKDNQCLVLQFSPDIIADEYGKSRTFQFHFNTTLQEPAAQSHTDEFRKDLAMIGLALYDKPDGYQFHVKSLLYRVIGNLFAYTKYDIETDNKAASSDSSLDSFERINSYIKLHYKEDITIDDLCRNVGVSKSSLYRLLRSTGSVTYKDLIDFYRIEHAKNLLKNTKNPIPFIAQSSGFDSDGSFYRAFKKNVGIAPHTYRSDGMEMISKLGIQGYTSFNMNEAKTILKSYL